MAPMMDTHPSPTEANLAPDTNGQVQWRPAKDYFLGGKGSGNDSFNTAIDDVEAVAPGFLLSDDLGLARIGPSPQGSREAVARLLQQNHDKWHMYFRNVAGHNHIPHALLSTFAMGGSPAELQRAYDDGEPIQKEKPLVDSKVVEQIRNPSEFRERMMILDEYSNFLAYFKQEIAAHNGDWRTVITKHCFSRSPLADLMLAQQFEGLYHPIIHTGFGIEFQMPGLVAEGLAQAASHDPMNIDNFLLRAERLALTRPHMRKPLIDLYQQCNTTEKIRTAARLPDGPWRVRDGVLGRALDEIVDVAAQFQVPSTPKAIEEAMLEMISCAAYACAAAHQPGKERKIDFFIMHSVTSSILFTAMIRQDWISLADKARLLEWKARMDLVWYAASAAPKLSEHNLTRYRPTISKNMSWDQIYAALNAHHDDGHVAKFVRAIKNGEQVSQSIGPVAGAIERFPVNDDMWLRVAQLCVDSTIEHQDAEKKWVWGAGFNAMWDRVPDQSTPMDPPPVFDNRYLCLTICGYRKPGMSEVDYRNHMVNVSAPLTKDLMVKYGVRRWTQIQNQTATRQMMTQLFDRQMSNIADFDCFSQVFFESLEDYKRMKQDPWFKEHLVNDHEEFADTKKSMMTIGWVHEYVRDGQIVDGFQ